MAFILEARKAPFLERLRQHNEGFFKDAYTQQQKDWEIFYSLECISFKQALKIEKHIKKMKSSKYINSLGKYVEIGEKLLQRYENDI